MHGSNTAYMNVMFKHHSLYVISNLYICWNCICAVVLWDSRTRMTKSTRTTASVCKPVSFFVGGKNIYHHHFSTTFYKNVVVSKQVKNIVAVLAISKWAQFPAIRITKQPMLLTKRKINRQGYKFWSINFCQKQSAKSRTCSRPHPRI
mgnify:CR=1 FL=1